MQRNLQRLTAEVFDVLVVGAGIHGAWIALRAAQAGYRVALIERNDFGAATSANSLKILHGGLRYLQNLDLPRMRSSIRARREFGRLTPHLVQPLACRIELHSSGMRSPWLMWPALLANDLISYDRNSGLAPPLQLQRGRLTSASECRQALAKLVASNAAAGAVWWDALGLDTGRLVLEPVLAAGKLGAVAANRVQAQRYLLKDGVVRGVVALDGLTQQQFDIAAAVTVNATGPWARELAAASGLPSAFAPKAWVGALNVVLRRDLGIDCAIGLSSRSRAADSSAVVRRATRDLFFVPWRGITMVGTDYHAVNWPDPSAHAPPAGAVREFMAELRTVAPNANLVDDDVSYVHWGIQPAEDNAPNVPRKTPIVAHGSAVGANGLLVAIAEKLTSAPELSRSIVRLVADKLPARKALVPSVPRDPAAATAETDRMTSERLMRRYGSDWLAVYSAADRDAKGALIAGCEALQLEVQHAVRHEMAHTLEDIVVRRLGLGQQGRPSADVIQAIATVAAVELAWDGSAVAQAVDALNRHYAANERWR
jgi:glycerol-3-phosphate dehydrogenase